MRSAYNADEWQLLRSANGRIDLHGRPSQNGLGVALCSARRLGRQAGAAHL